MHQTEIGIFKIAQTRVNWDEVTKWLEFLGVKDVRAVLRQLATKDDDWPAKAPEYYKVATDASALIALAGKRCYQSFEVGLNPNVSKIRTDHAEYITNILKSGHGSVLEHATWTFAIENVSRVFTGEMNRHRAGTAISEGSMRYIRFDDIGFTMPSSLGITREDARTWADFLEVSAQPPSEGSAAALVAHKRDTQAVFEEAFEAQQKMYVDLCNIWKIDEMRDFNQKKKLTSMFRRIIGMGVSTGGVWSMNARAMRFILEKRASIHAEEEIYDVFDRIATIMIAEEPLLFGDFTRDAAGSWVPKYSKV